MFISDVEEFQNISKTSASKEKILLEFECEICKKLSQKNSQKWYYFSNLKNLLICKSCLKKEANIRISNTLKKTLENLDETAKKESQSKRTKSLKLKGSQISETLKAYWNSKSEEELKEWGQLKTSQLKKWHSRLSDAERREIRRKANKFHKYKSEDGQLFDSSWELKYYEYCKTKGYEIIREPCSLQYKFEGHIFHYFPDFQVNGKLIEIKGDHLFSKMQIPFSKENAKYKCALENKVIFLLEKDLQELGILN